MQPNRLNPATRRTAPMIHIWSSAKSLISILSTRHGGGAGGGRGEWDRAGRCSLASRLARSGGRQRRILERSNRTKLGDPESLERDGASGRGPDTPHKGSGRR